VGEASAAGGGGVEVGEEWQGGGGELKKLICMPLFGTPIKMTYGTDRGTNRA